MSYDISKLKALNSKRWTLAKLTRRAEYAKPVERILAARHRYELIQRQTGVHWVFVACCHLRESNLDFSKSLAQGDPLDRVSRNVPKGRGPFTSFEEAAYDALVNCQPKAALNPIWKQAPLMPDMLTLLEMYNGLGYAYKGIPSPYIWSGTDQYSKGKYVRDGVFDPNVVDKQLGVAGLILCLLEKAPDAFLVKGPEKPVQPLITPGATIPAPNVPNAPQRLPEASKPVINADGEDITDKVQDMLTSFWEWLRKH